MRRYELTVLIDQDVNEEDVVNNIKKIVKDNNGEIEDVTFTNNQHLAYPVMGKEMCNRYEADCYFKNIEDAQKTSNKFNIEDGILRYLLCLASK